MDLFGDNLHVMSNDSDLDLIDPDKLYRSNDEVKQSDYLFEEATSNDSSYRDELFDYQTKTQNYESESLFARYETLSLSDNFQQSVPSNYHNAQSDFPFNGNIQNTYYDDFRNLELPEQAELQLPPPGYGATGSYNDFGNFSPFPGYADSGPSISYSNEAAGDYRQTFINPGQPVNNCNGNYLQGRLVSLDQVLPENSDESIRQRRTNRLPNAKYRKFSEEQMEKRRKKLASESSKRYTKKQKEKVKQLEMEENRLPISIQENNERIFNMKKQKEVLEKATGRLRNKQFNN